MLTFKKGVVVKCKCGFSTEQLRTRGCALCITFRLLLIGAVLLVIRFRLLTDGFFSSREFSFDVTSCGVMVNIH